MTLPRIVLALVLSQLSPTLHASTSTEPVTVIRNARVFDGVAATRSAPQDVLVRGGRIEAIGRSLPVEQGAREIDAGGRTLMPGMIDAHAHIMMQLSVGKALSSDAFYYAYVSTLAAKSFLDSGFTTVRDMSGNSFSLKQAIDEGIVPGPRIFPSGAMISQTAGHSDHRSAADPSRLIDPTSRSHLEELGMTVVADGRSEVLQAARENLRRGATQVKIAVGGGVASYADPLDVTQYTDDEIRAAVEAAQNWGTYVAAHVYNSEGIRRAIDNGVRSIEHANLVDRETLKYMKEKGVWLSPQVLVFQSEIRGLTPDQQAKQRQARDGIDSMMKMAREVGFENIVFGADVVTNLDALARIGEELTLRTRWFKPAEILRQATSKAGELLALSGPRNPYGTLGVIRSGAVADILVVDGDPLEDISVLANPSRNLRLIMKGGEVYKNTL
jgi:imidazolonepropionase-like amidohydrolase